MKPRSIGSRLALWYGGVLGLALTVFGLSVWFSIEHSLYDAVDESLRDRVEGVRRFIEQESSWLTLDEIRDEFREHSVLGPGGDLFQVRDAEGNWIYRSAPLYDEHVPIYEVAEMGPELRFENLEVRGAPLRFLAQSVEARGTRFVIQVAAPLHELRQGIADFVWALGALIPAVLLAASAGGYWISRRALRPVDEITQTARSISSKNLTHRVPVPRSDDELERLASTLNEMIQRLEDSFDRISRFTADASHELRTPLSLIRATAEVALRNEDHPDEWRQGLLQILAEVERTSNLVENLLLLARADSGQTDIQRSLVDLARTVEEACIESKPLAQANGLLLATSISHGPVYVAGDSQALRRLWLILIDNAVKFTPSGGTINVEVKAAGTSAVVVVRDTGCGIPPQELDLIFDRFYRVDKARERDKGGAGLGLAIARWIVDVHGGTIRAESQPGQGASFAVVLPFPNRQ
ncbi:MAG: HAMP domain-containing protein [Acidobacteria bacterium]|nr:HAMP domain-containing protein [Acidobacteriota bacterium]